MQTILAFGDSLTWGSDPSSGHRHPKADQWPSVLAAGLGEGFAVISEGLGGRTTAYDDWTGPADRNGARVLPTLLQSHAPLRLVILMLGTNDLKPYVAGSARAASVGMARLTEIVAHHPYPAGCRVPACLLVAPPVLVASAEGARDQAQIAASAEFAVAYRAVADQSGAAFFDAGTVATSSPIDGVHLDVENTRAIGAGLVPVVRRLLDA